MGKTWEIDFEKTNWRKRQLSEMYQLEGLNIHSGLCGNGAVSKSQSCPSRVRLRFETPVFLLHDLGYRTVFGRNVA